MAWPSEIFMPFLSFFDNLQQYHFVSPECSSERDYVITDSVRSMYVYVCGKDLSQFQWKSAHALKKELPKDFL